eukprot:jgi/Botrbrau1/9907/Bobra.0012s0009.2
MSHPLQMQNCLRQSSNSAFSDASFVTCCKTLFGTRRKERGIRPFVCQAASNSDPLLVRAARGEAVERPPCWMMRQAGRYQAAYRELATKYPSFRERSETADLIVQITLQPWKTFKPDGLILFSDILTPLPAIGVPFEVDESLGPTVPEAIRTFDQTKQLRAIDLNQVQFVGQALTAIREEVGNETAVLGFIGSPWTIATYIIEGGSSQTYRVIKAMIYDDPRTLDTVLSHLAKQLATYLIYQIESGAQYVQIFDSWGGFLPPAVIPVSALLHCFGLMSQSLGTSSVAIVNKASWEDPFN